MRSLSNPARSARRFTLMGPRISQSQRVLPSPGPLMGSLLVTWVMPHWAEVLPQLSVRVTPTLMGTILWLGGQRYSLLGAARTMVGGVVSTTVWRVVAVVVLPAASRTWSWMVYEPAPVSTMPGAGLWLMTSADRGVQLSEVWAEAATLG